MLWLTGERVLGDSSAGEPDTQGGSHSFGWTRRQTPLREDLLVSGTCVHTLVHLLITGLSIFADVTWRRRFYWEDEEKPCLSSHVKRRCWGCRLFWIRRSPTECQHRYYLQKSEGPVHRWTHLVYNYLEDRFLQESLCSQVWNECSHRELAALVGRLSVLAQGQEAALQEWVWPTEGMSHIPAIYDSILFVHHSFITANVSRDTNWDEW